VGMEMIEMVPANPDPLAKWNPIVGEETLALLEHLNLSAESTQRLQQEAVSVLARCTPATVPEGQETGLVLGYVQSGKTVSFTTVAALARDNGFRLIIVCTGLTRNLFNQSRERLERDLRLGERRDRQWLFLHNPRCWMSRQAYREMQQLDRDIPLVDVRHTQDLTQEIAQRTGVRHESTQVLLLHHGQAIWTAAHEAMTAQAVDAAVRAALSLPADQRITPSDLLGLTTLLLLGQLIYSPARGWIEEHWALPIQQSKRVVVVKPGAVPQAARGTWIAYQVSGADGGVVADEAGPGKERLEAARLAAVAGRPWPFAGAGPRHRVVAPFAGHSVGADQHPPVDHDLGMLAITELAPKELSRILVSSGASESSFKQTG